MFDWLRKFWRTDQAPVEPLRRPTGVSRRDFLRSIGVTTTTLYMGGAGASLWKPPGLVKPEAKMLEFFAYETVGYSMVNTEALAKVEFDPLPQPPQTPQEVLFEALKEPGSLAERMAIDAINAFTRIKMREDGFYRKVFPPMPIDNYGLDQLEAVDRLLTADPAPIAGPIWSPKELSRAAAGDVLAKAKELLV